MRPFFLLAATFSLTVAEPAHSAGLYTQADGPMTELARCRIIREATVRLACYDQAASNLTQAIADKEVVVLDSKQVRQTRRSLFGFTLPQLPFFGKESDEAAEAKEISATLTSVSRLAYGKWRVRLKDGAVWETTEASESASPRVGEEVTIKKAALGSYLLRFGSSRGLRARRVN